MRECMPSEGDFNEERIINRFESANRIRICEKVEKNIKQKKVAMTGAQAVAEALRQINPDVMPIYPITPQTPIIESFARLQAKRKVDTELITVESEHSAMSACIGSSAAGARTVTASSSQGLALMNEVLYIASGMRLPILMVVSARALSAPLNIHGDHSDVMSVRDTGWIQIFCENAQEVYDNTIIGMKLAEVAKIPVMVIMDGFITSHSVENLEILSDETVENFVGVYGAKTQGSASLLDFENPQTFGAMALPDTYFEFKISQQEAMEKSKEEFSKIAEEFFELKRNKEGEREKEKEENGTEGFFENYFLEDAEQVIVVAGSTAGSAKDVVDKLRSEGKKVGLLKIKLFRPFPHQEIAEALKNVKSIAVLDRALAAGTYPPIYSDIINSLNSKNHKPKTTSYVYGLGGRDIFKKDIEKVFEDLIERKNAEGIKYIK